MQFRQFFSLQRADPGWPLEDMGLQIPGTRHGERYPPAPGTEPTSIAIRDLVECIGGCRRRRVGSDTDRTFVTGPEPQLALGTRERRRHKRREENQKKGDGARLEHVASVLVHRDVNTSVLFARAVVPPVARPFAESGRIIGCEVTGSVLPPAVIVSTVSSA